MRLRSDPPAWKRWSAATLLMLFMGGAINATPVSAETEAETAAQTQRPLTEDEARRAVKDCLLPEPDGEVDHSISGAAFRRVRLSPQQFLGLLVYRSTPRNGDTLSAFRHLPLGGVGARDICGGATFSRLSFDGADVTIEIAGLRLRPDLELAVEYPSVFAELRRRKGQLQRAGAATYAVFEATPGDRERAKGLARRLRDAGLAEADALYFADRDKIYVELAK